MSKSRERLVIPKHAMLMTRKETISDLESRFLRNVLETEEGQQLDVSDYSPDELFEMLKNLDTLFVYEPDEGLTANKEITPNLTQGELSLLIEASEYFNKSVKGGLVSVTRQRNGEYVPAPVTAFQNKPIQTTKSTKSNNQLVDVNWYWWGVGVYLSHDQVNALAAAFIAGAGLMTLLAEWGVPAIVAAILAGIAGILKAFDHNKRGIYFFFTWFGGVWWILPV